MNLGCSGSAEIGSLQFACGPSLPCAAGYVCAADEAGMYACIPLDEITDTLTFPTTDAVGLGDSGPNADTGTSPPGDGGSDGTSPDGSAADTQGPNTDTGTAIDSKGTDAADTTPCVPDCAGKVCGDNGCEGLCGTCAPDLICSEGACITPPIQCPPDAQCLPGVEGTGLCGNCGAQVRTCTEDCKWGPWGPCEGEGVCASNSPETVQCGNCGNKTRICTNQCQWGPYGACQSEGPCMPFAQETTSCGNCGAHSRQCTAQCQWGDWEACQNQGACTPGTTQACGCGTQTCTGTCQWGSCADECKWYETCLGGAFCDLPQTLSYLRSPGPGIPAAFIAPLDYIGEYLEPAMGTGDPYWYLTQWGNPSPLDPANANPQGGGGVCAGGFDWGQLVLGIGNSHLSACWNKNVLGSFGYSVQFLADAGSLPCGESLTSFLNATAENYEKSVKGQGLDYGIIPDPPSLQAHDSLTLSFGAKRYWQYANPDGCPGFGPCDLYSGAAFALILTNVVTKQSLFFNIWLADTREGKGCGTDPCKTAPFSWWNEGSDGIGTDYTWFGLTDMVSNYGGNNDCLKPYVATTFSINILPRLMKAISEGPPSTPQGPLDKNLSNWQLTQLNFGVLSAGDTEMGVAFYDVDLVGSGNW